MLAMISRSVRNRCAAALVAGAVVTSGAAAAQNSGGFLSDVFGQRPQQDQTQMAQVDSSELVMRLERMENQMRQMTGALEQLQFRNQQLEQQLQRVQAETEYA